MFTNWCASQRGRAFHSHGHIDHHIIHITSQTSQLSHIFFAYITVLSQIICTVISLIFASLTVIIHITSRHYTHKIESLCRQGIEYADCILCRGVRSPKRDHHITHITLHTYQLSHKFFAYIPSRSVILLIFASLTDFSHNIAYITIIIHRIHLSYLTCFSRTSQFSHKLSHTVISLIFASLTAIAQKGPLHSTHKIAYISVISHIFRVHHSFLTNYRV